MKYLAVILMMGLAFGGEWVPLWSGEAPGAPRPAEGTEKEESGGRFGRIEQPEYMLFLAPKEKRGGQGVVIFPGGGYSRVAARHEGYDYAKWLNQRGISAMVVKYRVSDDAAYGYQFPLPFLDARRAIRTMRENAAVWGVKPNLIGVMGSSAGGHLASTCATRFGDKFEVEGNDEIDKQSCRPDFAILIYPVISMARQTHGGSRKKLLGDAPSAELVETLSTEMQVSKQTPPCFLLSTSDDFVDCRNSLLFAIACKKNGVPVALHLFEKGGHGYGLKGRNKQVAVWPNLLEAWLKR